MCYILVSKCQLYSKIFPNFPVDVHTLISFHASIQFSLEQFNSIKFRSFHRTFLICQAVTFFETEEWKVLTKVQDLVVHMKEWIWGEVILFYNISR